MSMGGFCTTAPNHLHSFSEDSGTARANRDYLRGLYGVIKDSDAHVRFTFLTGISRFSKVNLNDSAHFEGL